MYALKTISPLFQYCYLSIDIQTRVNISNVRDFVLRVMFLNNCCFRQVVLLTLSVVARKTKLFGCNAISTLIPEFSFILGISHSRDLLQTDQVL